MRRFILLLFVNCELNTIYLSNWARHQYRTKIYAHVVILIRLSHLIINVRSLKWYQMTIYDTLAIITTNLSHRHAIFILTIIWGYTLGRNHTDATSVRSILRYLIISKGILEHILGRNHINVNFVKRFSWEMLMLQNTCGDMLARNLAGAGIVTSVFM